MASRLTHLEEYAIPGHLVCGNQRQSIMEFNKRYVRYHKPRSSTPGDPNHRETCVNLWMRVVVKKSSKKETLVESRKNISRQVDNELPDLT
jgi:hypothetical protein